MFTHTHTHTRHEGKHNMKGQNLKTTDLSSNVLKQYKINLNSQKQSIKKKKKKCKDRLE